MYTIFFLQRIKNVLPSMSLAIINMERKIILTKINLTISAILPPMHVSYKI